ncbi:MAG: hypothetical protein ACTSV1_08235 [Alphaproteobacteria bacterium]
MKLKSAINLAAVIALFLSGCAMTPPAQVLPELTYAHLQSIRLHAGTLEIVSDYKSTMVAPNVEHRMETSPGQAFRRWAADRLVLTGGADKARLTIVDASVVETRLATQGGLKGAFISEQAERYRASLKVKLEIIEPGGASRGFASAEAIRSITVPEDASLNQREQVWFNLVEALMNDFNAEFEKKIGEFLPPPE